MDGQVKEVEQRNYTLRLKRKELSEKLEGVQAELETSRSKGRELRKEREVKRAEEVELTGDRYKLQIDSEIDTIVSALGENIFVRKIWSDFMHVVVPFITRGIMEMKLQSITCDKKHLCASQSLRLREKNRYTTEHPHTHKSPFINKHSFHRLLHLTRILQEICGHQRY